MRISPFLLALAFSGFATHVSAGYETAKIADSGLGLEMTVAYPQTGIAGIDADLAEFANGFAGGSSVRRKSVRPTYHCRRAPPIRTN